MWRKKIFSKIRVKFSTWSKYTLLHYYIRLFCLSRPGYTLPRSAGSANVYKIPSIPSLGVFLSFCSVFSCLHLFLSLSETRTVSLCLCQCSRSKFNRRRTHSLTHSIQQRQDKKEKERGSQTHSSCTYCIYGPLISWWYLTRWSRKNVGKCSSVEMSWNYLSFSIVDRNCCHCEEISPLLCVNWTNFTSKSCFNLEPKKNCCHRQFFCVENFPKYKSSLWTFFGDVYEEDLIPKVSER